MTMQFHPLPAQTAHPQAPEALPASRITSLGRLIADWLATAADRHAAATIYAELFRLSDAELARRGLSRATLQADMAATRSRRGAVE